MKGMAKWLQLEQDWILHFHISPIRYLSHSKREASVHHLIYVIIGGISSSADLMKWLPVCWHASLILWETIRPFCICLYTLYKVQEVGSIQLHVYSSTLGSGRQRWFSAQTAIL